MPDNDVRPIESDKTYIYDETIPGYRARTRTAVQTYRQRTNPSNFEPPPDEYQDDPAPPQEDVDIPPIGSTRVDYYDNLMPAHRDVTSNEVSRFGTELVAYADFYNEYIRKPGEAAYEMPVSQVEPLDVTDDGAERANESNLVSDYDVAASGYSEISVSSTETTGNRGTTYSEKMTEANQTFDTLLSDTSEDGIAHAFQDLTDYYDSTHNSTETGATDRSDMSVMEAGLSDMDIITDDIDEFERNVMGDETDPEANTINGFEEDIEDKIDSMPDNVSSGLIDISEYNAMSEDMLSYIEQDKTFDQFMSARGNLYSNRFTEGMMRACWDMNYNDHHS